MKFIEALAPRAGFVAVEGACQSGQFKRRARLDQIRSDRMCLNRNGWSPTQNAVYDRQAADVSGTSLVPLLHQQPAIFRRRLASSSSAAGFLSPARPLEMGRFGLVRFGGLFGRTPNPKFGSKPKFAEPEPIGSVRFSQVRPVRPVFGRFSASVRPFSALRTLSSPRSRLPTDWAASAIKPSSKARLSGFGEFRPNFNEIQAKLGVHRR
ncbi:hypothetical protein C8F01DRAFT_1084133 [Mycena amicta]|nr:hypothetical protein C8F01DRAFT_1084133 [Mycena amicta]